jgi:hypothetical protein
VSVVTRGDRELALRFDKFPTVAHQKLEERMGKIVAAMKAQVQAAAPHKTGKLRSEITGRVFADQPDRVAGYVEVYAPDSSPAHNEYAKAATLEYGTDLARRIKDHGGIFRKLNRGQKRIESHLTKAVHIRGFSYLRGSVVGLRGYVETELSEALAEATQETP